MVKVVLGLIALVILCRIALSVAFGVVPERYVDEIRVHNACVDGLLNRLNDPKSFDLRDSIVGGSVPLTYEETMSRRRNSSDAVEFLYSDGQREKQYSVSIKYTATNGFGGRATGYESCYFLRGISGNLRHKNDILISGLWNRVDNASFSDELRAMANYYGVGERFPRYVGGRRVEPKGL